MNPVVLLISILIAQVSSYKILTQQQAQGATNRLWDEIKVKGGCLFSDKLANAPSKNLAALWLRAVFHDSGSFNATSKTGGLDGSLALDSELSLTENGGIAGSLAHLSLPANSIVTKADAIALGGIVTVATCGGPKVNFTTGRVDATVANIAKDFPSDSFAPVSTMAAAFQRMGLSKLDMMTGAHKAISPALTNETFAPFDSTPGVFDNDIFKKVLAGKCIVPLDCAFAADSTLLPYIKQFSTDQDAFFAQYAISFQKMLSLTASTLSAPVPVNITVHVNLIPEGTFPTTTLIRPTSPPATLKSTAAASCSAPPPVRSPAPAPNSKSSPPPPRPTQASPARTQEQPPRPSNNKSARTTRNDQPTRTSSRR